MAQAQGQLTWRTPTPTEDQSWTAAQAVCRLICSAGGHALTSGEGLMDKTPFVLERMR